MKNFVNILGIKITPVTIDECVNMIMQMMGEKRLHYIFTPNSEIIMAAYKDDEFKNMINSADILTADGIGVVYGAKLLKTPVPQRAAGYDISKKLMGEMAKSGKTLFLLGAAPGVAVTAKDKLEKEFKNLKIVGTHDGYFNADSEDAVINKINMKNPDVLFVCLGSPKQEEWIVRNKNKLNAYVAIGLGGCLDVYAGNVKRAPDIFIKLGLEWFYRLIKEPKRFWRMLALPKFMLVVLKTRLFGNKK